MVQRIDELVPLFDLEEIEQGLFRGIHPQTRLQRSFGGQVLAQALNAALRTVPEGRQVHSLHSYFLRGGRTDAPIIYDVQRTRDGGTFSSRRVVARQHREEIFMMAASFQEPEEGVLNHQDPPPEAGDPENLTPLFSVTGRRWAEEWGVLDVRVVGDSSPGEKSPWADPTHRRIDADNHAGHSRVWVRFDGDLPDIPNIHPCALAWASDLTLLAASVVPHPDVQWGSPQVAAASLDHAMWFHRPVRADRWWMYDQITTSSQDSRGLSMGRIFQDGQLVATVAQEGLIRVLDGPSRS